VVGALLDLGPIQPLGDQHVLDVGLHRQPGIQGEGLEHDGHIVQQPFLGLAVVEHLALGGGDEAGEDPHDGGLAAAGRADEADELVALDGEVHVLQHPQGLAGAAIVGFLDAAQLQNGGVGLHRLDIHVCLTCPGSSG
jgi:hypothetical protein